VKSFRATCRKRWRLAMQTHTQFFLGLTGFRNPGKKICQLFAVKSAPCFILPLLAGHPRTQNLPNLLERHKRVVILPFDVPRFGGPHARFITENVEGSLQHETFSSLCLRSHPHSCIKYFRAGPGGWLFRRIFRGFLRRFFWWLREQWRKLRFQRRSLLTWR
jgi:hypothetical protein